MMVIGGARGEQKHCLKKIGLILELSGRKKLDEVLSKDRRELWSLVIRH